MARTASPATLPLRHARGRDRVFPRCRRDLVPAAPAGRDRHLLRADRRAARCGRCDALWASRPIGAVGAIAGLARRAVLARCRSTRVLGAHSPSRPRGGPLAGAAAAPSTACSAPTGSRTSWRRSIRASLPDGPDAEFARRSGHDPHQIAVEPQDRVGAAPAWQEASISRLACGPNSGLCRAS